MTKHSSDRRQKYHIIGQKTTFSTTPTYSENLTISSCTLKCLLYFLYLFTFLSQNLGSLHFSMSSNFLQYLIYARINKRHYICIKEYFRIMFGTKKTRDQIHTSTIFENLSPSGGFSDSSCDQKEYTKLSTTFCIIGWFVGREPRSVCDLVPELNFILIFLFGAETKKILNFHFSIMGLLHVGLTWQTDFVVSSIQSDCSSVKTQFELGKENMCMHELQHICSC